MQYNGSCFRLEDAVYIPFPVAITLDGKLNDWEGIPVQRVTNALTTGPDKTQNQYFDFSVVADEKNIYLYVFSEDSNIIAGKHSTNFWNEDSLEFYFNFTDKATARAYTKGIMQINVNATKIGSTDIPRP